MFVDTNVFVHATSPGSPERRKARNALAIHGAAEERLCISRQVLREFIAVITRPQTWAQAKTSAEAAVAAVALAAAFEIVEDGPAVWDELLGLCRSFVFGGRQVHDANIVATMLAHSERRLLTFNIADFRRFAAVIDIIVP